MARGYPPQVGGALYHELGHHRQKGSRTVVHGRGRYSIPFNKSIKKTKYHVLTAPEVRLEYTAVLFGHRFHHVHLHHESVLLSQQGFHRMKRLFSECHPFIEFFHGVEGFTTNNKSYSANFQKLASSWRMEGPPLWKT